MNHYTFSNALLRRALIFAVLCAGIFLITTAPAQSAPSVFGSRYLLIFDTSSAMKKRVPAARYTIQRLFFSMMNNQLHPGDSIGVWTFNRKLRAGDFPLQNWLPQNAALIASNITYFVDHQHYSRSARFDVVMPGVNNLVRNSERLTVLIFCDGEEEIKGTPFDDAINGIFKRNEHALKTANQAFIVVLRSQLGQYTGFTVNSSAVGVNFPEFPPLPAPPKPAPQKKTNPPPAELESNPPPVAHLPPLVIIGTNVSTNLIPSIPPTATLSNPPPAELESNPPPAASLTNSTNVVPPPAGSSASPLHATPPEIAGAHTNTPTAASEENPSGLSRRGALAIGGALLVAAVVLIIVALFRSRRANRGSLITRSMKKK